MFTLWVVPKVLLEGARDIFEDATAGIEVNPPSPRFRDEGQTSHHVLEHHLRDLTCELRFSVLKRGGGYVWTYMCLCKRIRTREPAYI